jgi:hypothetical protein
MSTVIEALTGSSSTFSCTRRARTEAGGFTYDAGYLLPYHEPSFGTQAEDGVLDDYADRVRFGLATFDGIGTYQGENPLIAASDFDEDLSQSVSGLWSYGPASAGTYAYPGTMHDYMVDTGIRSSRASDGALRIAFDDDERGAVLARIDTELLNVRPYGATPTAAALDDLYYLFSEDPDFAAEGPEDRFVVVITDGHPDHDFREFGCNCAYEQAADDGGVDACSELSADDVARMKCPYPTPEDAARYLAHGRPAEIDDSAKRPKGPRQVDRVYIVAFDVRDAETQLVLGNIASAGGTDRARHGEASASLRAALEEVFQDILRRAAR